MTRCSFFSMATKKEHFVLHVRSKCFRYFTAEPESLVSLCSFPGRDLLSLPGMCWGLVLASLTASHETQRTGLGPHSFGLPVGACLCHWASRDPKAGHPKGGTGEKSSSGNNEISYHTGESRAPPSRGYICLTLL